ncbi:MAG: AhpC/TSA family protein [Solirubrobacteraceae bacterium]
MLDHRSRIEAAGTAVIVVHDPPALLGETMLRDLDITGPFAVLVDLEMSAYRAWGLGRASLASTYLVPRVLAFYARRALQGERLHAGTDPRRLGGDFVIDAGGRVSYAHPQAAVDDRPPVGLLVRELERAARSGLDGEPSR